MRSARLALLVALALTAACSGPAPQPAPPAPAPAPFDWDAAARAPRSFTWRLETGAWSACTVVIQTTRRLAEEDADELEAVLTDWYNLARLGAFKDDPRQPGAFAAEAMGDPWQPAEDALAVTFDLGTVQRLGLVVLLDALEGYSAEQARLRDVVLCADQAPAVPPSRQAT
jgi:hypothetical protein